MKNILRNIVKIITVVCLMCLTFSATVWAVKEFESFSQQKPSSKEVAVVGAFSAPVRPDGTVMSVAEFQRWLKDRGYYTGKIDGWVSDDYINSLTQIAWDAMFNDQCAAEDMKIAMGGE